MVLYHRIGKAMSQNRLKIEVAKAALKHVEDGMVLGIGTGSTVNAFIDQLVASGKRLEAAVSSLRCDHRAPQGDGCQSRRV